MKKHEKKLEKQLIATLTNVCETAKCQYPGFQWLTHFADYRQFPQSLKVVCIFDNKDSLQQVPLAELNSLIQQHLERTGLYIRDIHRHVSLDTEASCQREHGGDWESRFRSRRLM